VEIVLLLLADYANISRGGKLNVMGVFDHLHAGKFPTRHPQMHLVLRLRAELGEPSGPRELTIKVLNQDGGEMVTLPPRKFTVPDSKEGRRSDMNFIIGIRDIVFPEPGSYEFLVEVNEEPQASIPLHVLPRPQRQA
jgi:hypothetical protein